MFDTDDFSSGIGVTELYKISDESRSKIASLLKGGDAYTPVSGDKISKLDDSIFKLKIENSQKKDITTFKFVADEFNTTIQKVAKWFYYCIDYCI